MAAKRSEKIRPDFIAFVEDDPSLREVTRAHLEDQGFLCKTFSNADAALTALRETPPDLFVCDYRMPRMDGLAFLGQVQASHPHLPVIMVTGFSSVQNAVDAMRAGAADYLQKPINFDELTLRIKKILAAQRNEGELRKYKERFGQLTSDLELVATAPSMHPIFEILNRVADKPIEVLIVGESGTGKEVVARYLHNHSPWSDGPFIGINCSAFPETLLEAELFGYQKGAFTGAVTSKPGLFEAAAGGTLLLDEIGDMPPGLQAKLLRVVQEREVRRLGSNQSTPVTARILAATNRDLEEDQKTGRFRSDLYFRLNVVPITIPPLRQRSEDVLPLARYFVEKHRASLNPGTTGLTAAAEKRLLTHHYPGNVRELENIIKRALVETTTPEIDASALRALSEHVSHKPPAAGGYSEGEPVPAYDEAKRVFEHAYYERLLSDCNGVISEVARRAGRARTKIYTTLNDLGLKPEDFRRS